MFDFYKYAETFNSGDDKAMVEGFWVDDLQVFSGKPEPLATGKKDWLKFLAFAHNGVREIMRVQAIIKSKNHIFAEIDMDFHASKSRPDYPFGPLEPGDFITVKMFVHYYMRGDKIAVLKMASWAPNVGVSDPPTRAFGPPPLMPSKARKIF